MFIVQVAGRLGKDPETRFTPSGLKVTNFNIAVNQRKGKEEVTTWVRITIWGERMDKMISFLKKGSAVIITGKMTPPSQYTDKDGRVQMSLEVTAEMIDFNPFGGKDQENQNTPGNTSTGSHYQNQNQNSESSYNEPFQGNANYTRSPSQSMVGQGNQNSSEDDLPF